MSDTNGKPADFEGSLEEIVKEFKVRPNQRFFEKIDGAPSVELNRALLESIQKLTSRTPDQILQTRAEIEARSTPPRPLPAGKTLEDVVAGTWPGDETDEEIRVALERLS